jgi:ribosomal protein S18 acetylase RimI-like enzyme
MQFRDGALGDIEQIASLHALSWQTAYAGVYRQEYLARDVLQDRLNVWRSRLSAPVANQVVVIAEESGALAGFVCAFGDHDPNWGSLIDNLHVAPHLKRGGIGTLLMHEAALRLRDRYPRSRVYLWALEANTPARRFYESLDARHAETVELETADGGMASSCRYVWPSPAALHDATLTVG